MRPSLLKRDLASLASSKESIWCFHLIDLLASSDGSVDCRWRVPDFEGRWVGDSFGIEDS